MSNEEILNEKGFFNIKDGSAEVFFDDLGQIQQIIFKNKRRKRVGEKLIVFATNNGSAIQHFDKDGDTTLIEYTHIWRRKFDPKLIK